MELEIGTIKTNVESETQVKRRPGVRTGRGSGGKNRGGGGGDNGNDGGDDNNRRFDGLEEFRPNKYRIGMWFTLLVVLMTFGVLIGAYVVIATNGAMEWKPFNLPVQVWVSTGLLLLSSITYEVSRIKLRGGKQQSARTWLLAATVLGGTFISSQLLVWLELYRQGVYLQSNPYAGFFYFLTAVHAVHIFGGICALGYILLRTWNVTQNENELEQRQMLSGVIGWYWHFMDVIWIVLLLLLAFFK